MTSISSVLRVFVTGIAKMINTERPANSFLDGHRPIPYNYVDTPLHAKNIINAINSIYYGRMVIPDTPLTNIFTIRVDFPLYDMHVNMLQDQDFVPEVSTEDAMYNAAKSASIGRKADLGMGRGFINCKYTIVCEGVDILTVWDMYNTRQNGINIGRTYGLTFFDNAALFKDFVNSYIKILLTLDAEYRKEHAAAREAERAACQARKAKEEEQKAREEEEQKVNISAAYQRALEKLK